MIDARTQRFAPALLLTIGLLVGASSCSGSDESSHSSEVSASVSEDSTANGSGQSEPESGETEETGETGETNLADVVIFEVLETEPTVAAPHPELAWSAVDGAASYDLIVLDGAGDPYWAWSGGATSVYLGGVENPNAVGAWVFEPLTWIVTARDSDGQPLAMSERAELLPG